MQSVVVVVVVLVIAVAAAVAEAAVDRGYGGTEAVSLKKFFLFSPFADVARGSRSGDSGGGGPHGNSCENQRVRICKIRRRKASQKTPRKTPRKSPQKLPRYFKNILHAGS